MIREMMRRNFVFAPVCYSHLARPFAGIEHIQAFFDLVTAYLPEEREKLLRLPQLEAAALFQRLFARRYFPLEQQNANQYDRRPDLDLLRRLTASIPVRTHGLSKYDYEPHGRMPPGQLLAAAICVCPFEDMLHWRNDPDGRRLVVIDGLRQKAPEAARAVARLLPEKGVTPGDFEAALKESKWPGLLWRCRWLFSQTGNVWLDVHGAAPGWTREHVERLTRERPAAADIQKQMDDFDAWLKVDFDRHAVSVVEYVAYRLKEEEENEKHEERAVAVPDGAAEDA